MKPPAFARSWNNIKLLLSNSRFMTHKNAEPI